MKDKITLEHWEADEYMVCCNGKPQGHTVTKALGEKILKEMQFQNEN